jgi:SPP1 family predicted phage head-tail adaptor
MRAGMLDRLITIQSKSEAVDAYGQAILTWSTFIQVRSNVVQKDGVEQTSDNNRSTKRMINFRVRYKSTITNEMRVLWENNYYKIEDIKELGRREGMLLITTKLAQT